MVGVGFPPSKKDGKFLFGKPSFLGGQCLLVVEPTHPKNMIVKMGTIFPKFRDENKKYLKPPPSQCLLVFRGLYFNMG